MRRFAFHLVAVPALAALLVAVGALSAFDLRVYDTLMRLHQAEGPPDLLLVRIDGEAQRRYPDFVDRRPLALARLVDRLNQVKPRVIGSTLAFDPRDPRDREGLAVLRDALGRHGNTVGMVPGPGTVADAEADFRVAERIGFQALGLRYFALDADHGVRGAVLAAPLAGALRPVFALAVLQRAGDRVPEARQRALQAAFESPDVAAVPFRFAFLGGPERVSHVSAADVLDGTVHPEAWRDRIVLIAEAGRGAGFLPSTPVSAWAGAPLHLDDIDAQVTAALLSGRVFRALPAWGEAALVGGVLLAFAVWLSRLGQRRALVWGLAAMVVGLLAYLLAYRLLFWLPPVVLAMALPLQMGVEFAHRFRRASAQLSAEIAVLRREAAAPPSPRGVDFDQALGAVREAIASLRRQREYVHRVIDVQPAAIVVVDGAQRLRLGNAQAMAWRADAAAPSGTLREWLDAVDLRLPADVGQYLGAGSARLLARCGERDVIVAFEPLPGDEGRGHHDTLVCVTEVSGLVADQRERQAAIDFLSHDLRAPAHALVELCEGLQGEPGVDAGLRGHLAIAERLARRMATMATTYLDFVRAASPEAFTRAEPVLLADVVMEAVETSTPEAAGKGVRLVLAPEGHDPGWVTGDAALLRRAVENLLSNAVKVTPAGGRVEVRVERRGAALAVAVRDGGPGIAPARRTQLFQRFGPLARTRKSSSRSVGLGLAMVMSVVARHRGTVFVDNPPGGGAEFRIELPLEVPSADESAA